MFMVQLANLNLYASFKWMKCSFISKSLNIRSIEFGIKT